MYKAYMLSKTILISVNSIKHETTIKDQGHIYVKMMENDEDSIIDV